MPSIGILSLGIPVRSPTLSGLNFPLATLVGITGKRKQFLICTQKTARAKLERLRSARLIKVTKRSPLDMQGFIRIKELISLLATSLSTIKHVN
jgi:hypothetical protein